MNFKWDLKKPLAELKRKISTTAILRKRSKDSVDSVGGVNYSHSNHASTTNVPDISTAYGSKCFASDYFFCDICNLFDRNKEWRTPYGVSVFLSVELDTEQTGVLRGNIWSVVDMFCTSDFSIHST